MKKPEELKKKLLHIDRDEWYPVYVLAEPTASQQRSHDSFDAGDECENDFSVSRLVEVSEDLHDRYVAALIQFEVVQSELRELYSRRDDEISASARKRCKL